MSNRPAQRHDRAAISIFAFLLALVIGLGSLQFKIFHEGADEQQHFSYASALRDNHFLPPDLNTLVLYDEPTRQRTALPNYLNHPATAYYPWAVLLAVDPTLSLKALRGVGLAIVLTGFALYLRLGSSILSTPDYTLYCLFPLVLWIPVMFGILTPDSIVTTGGICACFGWLKWDGGQKHWRPLLIGGFLLASVKLNVLLLFSFYSAFYLLLALKRRRLKELRGFIACAAISYIPYIMLWSRYGSPAPETPNQAAAISGHGLSFVIPDFFHYVLYALNKFALNNVVPLSATLLLVLLLLLLRQLVLMVYRPKTQGRTPVDSMLDATALAWFATLSIHLVFSYQRYLHYHWGNDFYLRYYMPLLPGFSLLFAHGLGQLGRRALRFTKQHG